LSHHVIRVRSHSHKRRAWLTPSGQKWVCAFHRKSSAFRATAPRSTAWTFDYKRHDARFHQLGTAIQDALLVAMQRGELTGPAWESMDCRLFFQERVLHDIVAAYYAHPEWQAMRSRRRAC
jgi:Gluconate 2-dehydrogenase subunit 3